MRILHFIGMILFLIATPAMAKDGGSAAWIVTQKSGQVQVVRSGMQPASVNLRATLSAGDIVATGTDGRAMLARGDDYVIVAPGSRLLLPKEEQRTGFTRLIQQIGTMLYKVRHTGVPHFAVETPMLAAVVKGTSFTVVVDKDRAAVQVTEGVVEVSSAAGTARRLVERGMTVYVGRERPLDIIEMKPGAFDLPSSGSDEEPVIIEGRGDIPLSTITNLTNGLVQEALAAPVAAVANAPTPQLITVAAITPVADVTAGTLDLTVTTPAVTVGDVTVPSVTIPVASLPEVTIPSVSTPALITPAITTPIVTVPAVTIPAVTVPAITVPVVTTPVITTPVITTPVITTPVITTPVITTPVITTPIVTVPAVTIPAVTVPAVTVPVVTTPVITTPVITTPIVTIPAVTVPAVTVPAVTVPAVTVPTGIVTGLLGL